MNLYDDFPTGWFWNDHLWWGEGEGVTENTIISRGAVLEVPDLRTADNRLKNAYRRQNLSLLDALPSGSPMQIHWTVEDDYFADLERFDSITDTSPGMTRWCRDRRRFRTESYRRRLAEGVMRRERVHIYIGQRCSQLKGQRLGSREAHESVLRGMIAGFDTRFRLMQSSYSIGKWQVLDSDGHLKHIAKVLNPSASQAIASGEAFGRHDEELSVRANCLRSPFVPFRYGLGNDHATGLHYDGFYHAMFVLERPPMQTWPGILLDVLSANQRNCAITQVIYPQEVSPEIERLRLEVRELTGQMNKPGMSDLADKIREIQMRIRSLQSSIVLPFKVLTVLRVWEPTPDLLRAAVANTKGALARLSGAGYQEVTLDTTAWHIFRQCMPGYFADRDYRGWDRYMTNQNLADLMPISSTFTGNLDEAQALFDSPGGGVVGVRFFAGSDFTPQIATVTGINGAGKSSLIIESLGQCEHMLDYTYLQEEGMALATYAMVRGIPSVALKESSDYTLNPFDTFGLPLSAGNVATVSKVGMKFVGLSADDDRNKRRENLIGRYVSILYREFAEDWKDVSEGRYQDLTRRTLAVQSLRKSGTDFLDAFVTFRDREQTDPEWARELIASFKEDEVIACQTSPQTRDLVASMVYTQLTPDDYPQWAGLVGILGSGRLQEHKTGAIADDLTMIATDLAQGNRFGGRVGGLVDGPTNVPLFGKGLHFDTSYLSDGMLKEVAGFLFPEMVRKHIMSMPRAKFKVMFIDELKRIIRIPGAIDYIQEMLAQLRKYRACFIGAFQTPSQIDEVSPALSAILMGQAKQHFILRHNDAGEVDKIAKAIGLPDAAKRDVLSHPLLEHQRGKKATYFTLYSNEGLGRATCGTGRVELDEASLYVVSSNGDVFDQKMRVLGDYPDTVSGVYSEVAKAAKARAASLEVAREEEAAAL